MGDEKANAARAYIAMNSAINKKIEEGEGRCILAASLSSQEAFGSKKDGHSVFTRYMIDGLMGAKGESVDLEGSVTPQSLAEYAYREIMHMPVEKRPNQKPILKTASMGTFALAIHPSLAKEGPMEKAFNLLKEGKVKEFNDSTEPLKTTGPGPIQHGYLLHERLSLEEPFQHRLDFSGKYIINGKLANSHLYEADICRTILINSDLSTADLHWANLGSARLDGSILKGANLENAYLSGTDLLYTDLSDAKLSHAFLLAVNLYHAKLSRAKLCNSVIVGCESYDDLVCDDADFDGAILDDEVLAKHLSDHGAKNVSGAVKSKKELISKLENKGIQGRIFEKILQHSFFPQEFTSAV